MSRLRLLILATFVESFATILVERAVYFYTTSVLHYTDTRNLLIALGLGVTYVIGARSSHAIAQRLGEKKLLLLTIAGQCLTHLLMLAAAHGPGLVTGILLIGVLNGLKWPVVESYVSAGLVPSRIAKAIGQFNISWSTAVPLSLAATGPLLAWWSGSIFAVAAVLNGVAFLCLCFVERRPVHLPEDHPERVETLKVNRYHKLLVSSRWSMLSSYALLFLLAPLLPGIFMKMQVPLVWATGLTAVMDVMRVLSFVTLRKFTGWHGRMAPALAAVVGLPAGFFMILFGADLTVVLAGELLFGIATGVTYYAALYYGMVVHNASVDAGGAHEGLIGLGFTLGPATGLAGRALAPLAGGYVAGMLFGVVPLILVCTAGALRPLRKEWPQRGAKGHKKNRTKI